MFDENYFDPDYFFKIHKYLNTKPGQLYLLSELTKEPVKFLFHIKYYIQCTVLPPHPGWYHIYLIEPTETEIMGGLAWPDPKNPGTFYPQYVKVCSYYPTLNNFKTFEILV